MSPLVIVPIVLIIIGVVKILWPEITRTYEQGVFRSIKDDDEYINASRVFGVLFLILGLGTLILLLAGAMKTH